MTREEIINEYLKEHRHDVLLNPYAGLLDFAKYLDEHPELPIGLEEAAKQFVGYDMDTENLREYELGIKAFIVGAKWDMAKMMENSVEGVVQDDGQFINFGDGRYIDLNPTMGLKPVFELTDGDKVKVIIVK